MTNRPEDYEEEGGVGWAQWKATGEEVKKDPRDVEYLISQLDLPPGLTLVTRNPGVKDGRNGYAVITTETGQALVTFELSMFFNSSQIDILRSAVNAALARAESTGMQQTNIYRDPNAE